MTEVQFQGWQSLRHENHLTFELLLASPQKNRKKGNGQGKVAIGEARKTMEKWVKSESCLFWFCIRWECGGGGEIKKTSEKTKYACENLPIYLVTRRTYVGHGSDSFCSAIRLYFLATLE